MKRTGSPLSDPACCALYRAGAGTALGARGDVCARALRLTVALAAGLGALLVAGCATSTHRAPVEQRVPPAQDRVSPTATPASPATTSPAAAPVAGATPVLPAPPPLPGAENAGKPGYYTVRPGDTLIRIGLEHGQNWRDIARWSQLENPNAIEVGQVLRVVPPASAPAEVVVATGPRAVSPPGTVDTRGLEGRGATPSTGSPAAAASAAGPTTGSAPAAAAAPVGGDDEVQWAWPAAGAVLVGFDEGRNKGLAIGGRAGDPVLAAADGRVVYAGSGLRGYGNLVIVKHNAIFLTAYAHNQTLLVKEDQVVRRGQRIAEMGNSDAERVQLHFEVRRQGRPVDPARLLPPR